jgi:hypothetical protein
MTVSGSFDAESHLLVNIITGLEDWRMVSKVSFDKLILSGLGSTIRG